MSAILVATVAGSGVWLLTPPSAVSRRWASVARAGGASGRGAETVAVGCATGVLAIAMGLAVAIVVSGLVFASLWWRLRCARTLSRERVNEALPGVCDHQIGRAHV